MVLCRNAMFAFQQPLMLLIHIVPVQTKGLWDDVHLKSWKWCKKAFEYILKKPQCSDAVFPDTEDIERKKTLSSSESASNLRWGRHETALFSPHLLCLCCVCISQASRAQPLRRLPQLMHWSWLQERGHRAAVKPGALRLWQGPPANSLISLKPSTIVFSCACVALERQGVAGAYICLIWTIRHFSEALRSYCS